ncbi:AfsR/SARP family transcriptional regulator [Catellatospora citrea]|uniref:SARP family transcriptional regulator n=1 Tax=Catellatospora citrea TaxID=53366 RepID=A0A8J3KQ56_9ACTN|nr:BTAD domain-containing putative transcriptional regulator [Catellatospora citrea]RKE10707.1 DNA-binding SARP family transcriptional activator [Catellatospora citrea]GIG01161.1 SARP family transcriptional regulator [Catellatospora citrea]
MTAAARYPAGAAGPGHPDTVRLQVMGPLRAWRGGAELDVGPRQQRCLLALLLARVGEPLGMTDLVTSLWGDQSPASAVNVIHKYIGALRRLLEPGLAPRTTGSYLVRTGNGYRFTAGPDSLDVVAFRDHVSAARASSDQGRAQEALSHYLEALRLCRGTAGESLADSPAATAIFAGVDGEFFEAVVAAAGFAIRLHEPARVLSPLRLAAEMDPFNELVHAELVTALAASGQQAEALAVYRTIRDRLVDELGIDPGYALQEAHRQVLAQSAAPPVEQAPRTVPEAAPGTPPLVRVVRPAQLPPELSLFVGRTAELAALGELAADHGDGARSGPPVVAIDGMGGVGKSTLATHFAHRIADRFTDGQLYLDLLGDQNEHDSLQPGDTLRSLLFALGVTAAHLPDTFDARLGKYRSLTAGKRMLVLLDNVRDSAQVRPLLPNSHASLVLVTSRRPLLGLAAFDGAHLMRLHVPDRSSAQQLLQLRLPGPGHRTAEHGALLDEIIELCGRLPLALAVLAARLTARPMLSLASVAADLRDGARRLEALSGGVGTPDPRTAFSWSYQQLSPGAARLFRLLSESLCSGITAEACASLSGLGLASTRAELAELTEAALVTEQEEDRYTSHMLVKAYAQELFQDTETPAERRDAISRLLQYYLHSSHHAQVVLAPHRLPVALPPAMPGVVPTRPTTYEQASAWFAAEREALVDAVRRAAEPDCGIVPWQLAVTMQQYLQWAGYFQDWEGVMRLALQAARDSGDEIGEAHVLRGLAVARWSLRDNDEALTLLTAALEIFDKHAMPLEQALVHTNLHWVYEAFGRDEEALAQSQQALVLYRALNDHLGVTFSLMANGRSLARLGRLEESAELLEQALVLHEQIRGRHGATWDATSVAAEAETRMAIASNLAQLGRPDEAAAQLELSARMSQQISQRPNQFEALRRLTELLAAEGDTAGADSAFSRARTVLAEFPGGGPEHLRARLVALADTLARTESENREKSPSARRG